MNCMNRMTWAAVLLAATAATSADPVKFTAPPTATRTGEGVKIEFAVGAATDVAVYVEDVAGNVVRHLAAGVLGPNAPAPLKADSLTQTLIWDGKDNAGLDRLSDKAQGGPFKVRVGLGLAPAFDGFLLNNPDATPTVHSVAVGPGGRVYAFYSDPTANGNQGGLKIKVLDGEGRHVKMLMPFAAELPFERIAATGAFRDPAGRTVPKVWNWHTLNFYPDPQIARRRSMSSLSLPTVDANGRVYWIVSGNRLAALDADGGVPYDTFISEPLMGEEKTADQMLPALAVSGDGKHLYLSGLGHSYTRDNKLMVYTGYPCVVRIDAATRKAAVFVGKPDQPGADGALLTRPRGVAVAGGMLYVADPGADGIAVFRESDGGYVGRVAVKSPQTVDVDPKTGAIYACVYTGDQDADLVKFNGYVEGKELYRISLPKTGLSPNGGTLRIVGDFSGERPRFWVPGIPYGRTCRRLGYFEDDGRAFQPHDLSPIEGPWGDGPRDLLVDRARDELYVKVNGEKWHQFDEKTGELVRTVQFPKNFGGPYSGSAGSQLGVDSAGNYITHCWGQERGLMRWTRELQPYNWDGQDTHRTSWGGMMTFQLNYMAIHNDQIYVIKPEKGPHHLDVYDMGLNRKRRVVWNVRRGSCPRVDAAGNVYITVPFRPLDRDFPEFFDGKVDPAQEYYRNIGEGNYWYTYMVASIVKFPPVGGAFHWIETSRERTDLSGLPASVAARPKLDFHYFQDGRYARRVGQVQGAEWVRFGFSPYSETYSAGTPVCMCEGAGFDVDGFGRVFYPDLLQFRVEVVDTANNPLTRFGRYGNQDDAVQPGAADPPLAWNAYVAVSDRYAYINDTINMRVVRMKLNYAAEQTCPIGQ